MDKHACGFLPEVKRIIYKETDMTHKKMLFIYNPISGVGVIRKKLSDILSIFTGAGFDVTVHPTQSAGDASETAMRLGSEYDIVACAGGDGTLDEVASGLKSAGITRPIGYIPCGSTNDIATTLEIPKKQTEAAKRIVSGEPVELDLGMFNDKYFLYVAAFGLFTDVSYTTNQNLKNVLGHAAYILEAGKRIFNVPVYKTRVEYGETQMDGEFIYGMVTNSRSVAGVKNLGWKEVDLNDGLHEVILIKPIKNPAELASVVSSLLSEKDSDLVIRFKAKEVKISMNESVAWTIDGEGGGSYKSVDIVNIRSGMTLIL